MTILVKFDKIIIDFKEVLLVAKRCGDCEYYSNGRCTYDGYITQGANDTDAPYECGHYSE